MQTRFGRLLDSLAFRSFLLATLLILAAFFVIKPDIHGHYAEHTSSEAKEAPRHGEQDKVFFGLSPEGWTAFWTFGLCGATVALFVATYALFDTAARESDKAEEAIEVARISAEASRVSADIARNTLIASHRAWIKPRIEVGDQPLLFINDFIQFSVNIFAENIGNTPAIFVDPDAWLLGYSSEPGHDVFTRHREKCSLSLEKPWGFNHTLWPGEKFPEVIGYGGWGLGVRLDKEDVDLALQAVTPEGNIMLYVGGAINYTFPSDAGGRHQSTFFFELRRRDSRPISVREGPIKCELLCMHQAGFGVGHTAT